MLIAKRRALSSICIVFPVLIVIGLLLNMSIDAPPPEDADLLLDYAPPPASQNGYLILVEAQDLVVGDEREINALGRLFSARPRRRESGSAGQCKSHRRGKAGGGRAIYRLSSTAK